MKPWSHSRPRWTPLTSMSSGWTSNWNSFFPATLVIQLEKSLIAKLISEHIGIALNHMDKLRACVEDISSKVLVTGDLNAASLPSLTLSSAVL